VILGILLTAFFGIVMALRYLIAFVPVLKERRKPPLFEPKPAKKHTAHKHYNHPFICH
jgi:hypothetical protein